VEGGSGSLLENRPKKISTQLGRKANSSAAQLSASWAEATRPSQKGGPTYNDLWFIMVVVHSGRQIMAETASSSTGLGIKAVCRSSLGSQRLLRAMLFPGSRNTFGYRQPGQWHQDPHKEPGQSRHAWADLGRLASKSNAIHTGRERPPQVYHLLPRAGAICTESARDHDEKGLATSRSASQADSTHAGGKRC